MAKEMGSKSCLNCSVALVKGSQYCSNCGQQIDENNLKLGVVLREFFENYISFDSRLGRTIFPFLFRPGFLTIQFNLGIRKKYANPFRFYILISIFFFFVISNVVVQDGPGNLSSATDNLVVRDFEELPDSEEDKINERVSNIIISEINDSAYIDSSFKSVYHSLTDFQKNRLNEILDDSIQRALNLPEDSVYADAAPNVTLGVRDKGGFGIEMDDFNLKPIQKYLNDPNYSDKQLLDSLDVDDIDKRTEFIYIQVIRMSRASIGSVNKFIIKNMSFAMFLVLPTTALFLFMFYFRRNKFYVEHLIHSFHLHSFVLFIYGLMLLIAYQIGSEDFKSYFVWTAFILSLVYVFRSFMVVYKQKLSRTIIKFIFISLLYWLNLFLIVIVDSLVSFLLF